MQVNVSVMLGEGEALAGSAEEAATAVLVALGADLEGDHCVISVSAPPERATAGPTPPPPPLEDTATQLPYVPPDPLPELTEKQLPAPEVTSE